uniref:trypsin n=1 Tax=Cyprinus carpio TaxID=7962 RepID=A0A8C2JK33_CYPCA
YIFPEFVLCPILFLSYCYVFIIGGMESGIIGGKDAKPHSRPYMASIQYKKYHTCGGMLIREDYVLTAAHCWNENAFSDQDNFEVVLGAHNITKVEKNQQRIPVMKIIQHSMFKQNKEKDYSYDIMLLKVFSPSPGVTLLCTLLFAAELRYSG